MLVLLPWRLSGARGGLAVVIRAFVFARATSGAADRSAGSAAGHVTVAAATKTVVVVKVQIRALRTKCRANFVGHLMHDVLGHSTAIDRDAASRFEVVGE